MWRGGERRVGKRKRWDKEDKAEGMGEGEVRATGKCAKGDRGRREKERERRGGKGEKRWRKRGGNVTGG